MDSLATRLATGILMSAYARPRPNAHIQQGFPSADGMELSLLTVEAAVGWSPSGRPTNTKTKQCRSPSGRSHCSTEECEHRKNHPTPRAPPREDMVWCTHLYKQTRKQRKHTRSCTNATGQQDMRRAGARSYGVTTTPFLQRTRPALEESNPSHQAWNICKAIHKLHRHERVQ